MQGFFLAFTCICLQPTRPEVVFVVLKAGPTASARLPRRLGRQRPAVAPDPVRLARLDPEAQRAHPALAAPAERLVDASFADYAVQKLGPFVLANKDSKLEGCR